MGNNLFCLQTCRVARDRVATLQMWPAECWAAQGGVLSDYADTGDCTGDGVTQVTMMSATGGDVVVLCCCGVVVEIWLKAAALLLVLVATIRSPHCAVGSSRHWCSVGTTA